MNRIPTHSFVASLTYYKIASGGFSGLICEDCRDPLDIHQPNPQQPDQFLGTCSTCGRWYRVAPSTEEAGLTVIKLPEVSQIAPGRDDPS